jgi:hypothetical protein
LRTGYGFHGTLGILVVLILSLIFIAQPAFGQLGGEQIRGDLGLKSGTQAPPGLYIAETLYFYRPTEVTGVNGAALFGNLSLNLFAPVLGINYVAKKKILGAHYGAAVAMWIMNQKLALPNLRVNASTYGFGDTYVSPVQLGWNFKRADVIATYAFYAPTGRYTAGASDNTGWACGRTSLVWVPPSTSMTAGCGTCREWPCTNFIPKSRALIKPLAAL